MIWNFFLILNLNLFLPYLTFIWFSGFKNCKQYIFLHFWEWPYNFVPRCIKRFGINLTNIGRYALKPINQPTSQPSLNWHVSPAVPDMENLNRGCISRYAEFRAKLMIFFSLRFYIHYLIFKSLNSKDFHFGKSVNIPRKPEWKIKSEYIDYNVMGVA